MELHLLCDALWAKAEEQIERAGHLISILPGDRLDWLPPIPGAWPAGVLLGHLLDCLAGFCAALQAAAPRELAHFTRLRDLPVNRACSPKEAADRVAVYRDHIEEGFHQLTDADLSRRLPTIFVPEGELLVTLLLGNLEHLVNHKYQLFIYLKLMGVPVESRDLYRFR